MTDRPQLPGPSISTVAMSYSVHLPLRSVSPVLRTVEIFCSLIQPCCPRLTGGGCGGRDLWGGGWQGGGQWRGSTVFVLRLARELLDHSLSHFCIQSLPLGVQLCYMLVMGTEMLGATERAPAPLLGTLSSGNTEACLCTSLPTSPVCLDLSTFRCFNVQTSQTHLCFA